MTEEEWLACTDPEPMLDHLAGRPHQRKLRLFACACCRRLWHLLTDPRQRAAVEVCERRADGLATHEEQRAARAASLLASEGPGSLNRAVRELLVAVQGKRAATLRRAARCAARAAAGADGSWWTPWGKRRAREDEQRAQATLLRDLFGNPFRRVALDRAVLTWYGHTVPRLARGLYEERAFDQLPVLADALEDAGCDDASVLAHCRGPGPHVRGCWVLD